MGKLISIAETARRFGMTEQSLRNWIDKGYIDVKKVGRARYIDENTIYALQDDVEDIARQQKMLESLREEQSRDIMLRYDEKVDRRYERVAVTAARNSGIFRIVVGLLHTVGSLNARERDMLMMYLDGWTYEEIGEDFCLTRERVRQVVEKAIRKSNDISKVVDKIDEYNALQDENSRLRVTLDTLSKRLAEYTSRCNETESAEPLCQLFATDATSLSVSARVEHVITTFVNKDGTIGLKTIGDVCRQTRDMFRKQRCMGKKSLLELEGTLGKMGLRLGMDVDGIILRNCASHVKD